MPKILVIIIIIFTLESMFAAFCFAIVLCLIYNKEFLLMIFCSSSLFSSWSSSLSSSLPSSSSLSSSVPLLNGARAARGNRVFPLLNGARAARVTGSFPCLMAQGPPEVTGSCSLA